MASQEERHSEALEIELISDEQERARREAENGLRQFDEVIEQINYWLQPKHPFQAPSFRHFEPTPSSS